MRIFGADQGVRMTLFPEHVEVRRALREAARRNRKDRERLVQAAIKRALPARQDQERPKRSVVARVGGWVRGLFGRRESKGGGK